MTLSVFSEDIQPFKSHLCGKFFLLVEIKLEIDQTETFGWHEDEEKIIY